MVSNKAFTNYKSRSIDPFLVTLIKKRNHLHFIRKKYISLLLSYISLQQSNCSWCIDIFRVSEDLFVLVCYNYYFKIFLLLC